MVPLESNSLHYITLQDCELKHLSNRRYKHCTCFTISAPVKEYCQIEKFSGKCQDGEIIVMDYAFYGRMNAGRCISGEGQLGCGTDARVHMDGLCSGRRTCEVSVFTLAEIFNPCKRDYTLYLEAAYSCKSGIALYNNCSQGKN